jgi:hypothetical protein
VGRHFSFLAWPPKGKNPEAMVSVRHLYDLFAASPDLPSSSSEATLWGGQGTSYKTQPSLHNPRWWPVLAATPRGVHFHETCLPHRYRAGGERAVRQVCDGNEHGPHLPHCTKIQTVGFDRTSKSSHAGSVCVATPRFHHGDTSVSNLKARLCFLSLNTPRFVDGSPSRLLLLSIRCFVVMGTGI